MANSQETQSPEFKEFVIEKGDFKPQFVWQRIRPQSRYGIERQVPSITLTGEMDGEPAHLVLQGKPFSRFLQFMGVGKRAFMKQMYRYNDKTSFFGKTYQTKTYIGSENAQKLLEAKYPEASVEKFKILLVDNKVARITSEDYIGIPHSFVQEVIENRLNAEGIEYHKQSRFGGSNGVYVFKNTMKVDKANAKVGDEIAHSVSYMNRNSGDKSLKLFGGAVVLVCSNGMTSGKAQSTMRIVHKLELGELRKRIEQELGKILEKIPLVSKDFMKLRKYKVTKEEAKILVEALPISKYLREAIWERLFTPSKKTMNGEMDWDGTMWGLYMAATYIASNNTEIQKSRRSTKSVDEEIVERLSSVQLFQQVWEEREKILEKSNAPKVEIAQK